MTLAFFCVSTHSMTRGFNFSVASIRIACVFNSWLGFVVSIHGMAVTTERSG
jgi:hypothetical protein